MVIFGISTKISGSGILFRKLSADRSSFFGVLGFCLARNSSREMGVQPSISPVVFELLHKPKPKKYRHGQDHHSKIMRVVELQVALSFRPSSTAAAAWLAPYLFEIKPKFWLLGNLPSFLYGYTHLR